MNRRNIFLIALIAVFCVILTGCGDNKTSVEPESSPIVYKTEKIQFHQISFDVPDQKEYGRFDLLSKCHAGNIRFSSRNIRCGSCRYVYLYKACCQHSL